MNKEIIFEIYKAIRAQSWLRIEYINKKDEKHSFWLAVQRIDFEKQILYGDAFQSFYIENETGGILEHIPFYLSKILSAKTLDQTNYIPKRKLLDDIEKNATTPLGKLFNKIVDADSTIDYLIECSKLEATPYITEWFLDQNVFTVDENDKQLISLGEKETIQFFKKIDGFKKNKAIENKNKEFELCLSQLCLNYDDKKFVVFYKKAHFNPAKKTITISNQLFFNMAFYLEKPSKENMYQPAQKMIRDYLDIDTEDFLTNYESNPEYWKDEISKVAKSGEVVDDHPYVFVQARDNGSTSRELFHIKELAQKNNLSVPLKAFFGQMKKTLIRSAADFSILNLDQPNIDQLLVVYNSLLQPITYVQGPPGTGKTRTIVNIIFSIIFNGQTALITSNNNKPINDIVEKLDSYNTNKTGKMLLPFIRLGNYEETIAGLRTIIPRLEIALRSKFNAGLLKKSQNSNKSAVKQTLKRLNDYELRKELEEEINAFDSLITRVDILKEDKFLKFQMEQKKAELKRISVIDEAEIIKNLLVDEQRVKTWLHFSTAQKLLKLKEKEYEDLMNIISIEDDKEMCKAFFEYISVDSNLATNLTAYRFGSTLPNFDLTIIDEAAQCTISGSLPAIARGKRLLLSGDVLQLRPITNVPDPTNLLLMEKHDIRASYDYNKNSILSTMQNVDTISKFLLLTKHFRCHPDIISFSNKKYYHGKLHPVKSRETNRSPLQLYAISNVVVQEKVPKNTNFQEISIIRNLLLKMSVEERLSTSIISPFRAQVALIKDMCDNNDLKVMDIGTVHTFQGKENETIIFSSVINESTPQRTFEWLSNNQELINVAISRAKNKFIFVGNQSEIIARSKQGDDLFELVEYIASRGESIEALTKKGDEHYINSANYKQYNSAKEKEFEDTLNYVMNSKNLSDFRWRTKVYLRDVLPDINKHKQGKYGFMAHFDFVIFGKSQIGTEYPVVAIELDGSEHLNDEKVQDRDKKKQEIAEDYGVKLIRIKNDFSRRYIFLRDILGTVIKESQKSKEQKN